MRELKKLAEELEQKKAQTDHLLFECIPVEIAEQLRTSHNVAEGKNTINITLSHRGTVHE